MTAEIAVMNRSSVALAADSAVTVESGAAAKVYNTVNKLFTLSKHHPVGVMFYGNADFMHIPWETIIKLFREKLRDKKHDVIRNYGEEFINFLRQDIPCPEEQQKRHVFEIWSTHFANIDREIHGELLQERSKRSLSDNDVRTIIREIIRNQLESVRTVDNAESMTKQKPEDILRKYQKEFVDAQKRQLRGRPLTEAAKKALKEYAGLLVVKNIFSPISSGVVIAGFGDKELFPSLISFQTDGVINGTLKVEETGYQDIARDNRSSIHSFAQGEMVVQFMEGVDQQYRDYFELAVSSLIEKIAETIIEKYTSGDARRKKQRTAQAKRATRKMLNQLLDNATDVRKRYYIRPVISAIGILPKEELANLAEALVSITSLKRRVSMDMDTVGGPIDVAVISKGDGFIWIKRKHYFDQELNPYFLSKYFDEIGVSRRVKK